MLRMPNHRASFAASVQHVVRARPGQMTRFICGQALALIPAMCLTLGLKRILVVFILPQTNTDGFAFCSNRLERARVPVTGARGGRRCRAAGLCGTGGRGAGRKRNAPQCLVHSVWSGLKEGSPPDCRLLPRRIYLSMFCLSIPTGNADHPFAHHSEVFSFFFSFLHTGCLWL